MNSWPQWSMLPSSDILGFLLFYLFMKQSFAESSELTRLMMSQINPHKHQAILPFCHYQHAPVCTLEMGFQHYVEQSKSFFYISLFLRRGAIEINFGFAKGLV